MTKLNETQQQLFAEYQRHMAENQVTPEIVVRDMRQAVDVISFRTGLTTTQVLAVIKLLSNSKSLKN